MDRRTSLEATSLTEEPSGFTTCDITTKYRCDTPQQDTKEYLQRGVLNWNCPGVKKGEIKGEMKREEVAGE